MFYSIEKSEKCENIQNFRRSIGGRKIQKRKKNQELCQFGVFGAVFQKELESGYNFFSNNPVLIYAVTNLKKNNTRHRIFEILVA